MEEKRNPLGPLWEKGKGSLAFPAISTGAYGFPKEAAAEIAVRETRKALEENPSIEKVLFVCFDSTTRNAYEAALSRKAR